MEEPMEVHMLGRLLGSGNGPPVSGTIEDKKAYVRGGATVEEVFERLLACHFFKQEYNDAITRMMHGLLHLNAASPHSLGADDVRSMVKVKDQQWLIDLLVGLLRRPEAPSSPDQSLKATPQPGSQVAPASFNPNQSLAGIVSKHSAGSAAPTVPVGFDPEKTATFESLRGFDPEKTATFESVVNRGVQPATATPTPVHVPSMLATYTHNILVQLALFIENLAGENPEGTRIAEVLRQTAAQIVRN